MRLFIELGRMERVSFFFKERRKASIVEREKERERDRDRDRNREKERERERDETFKN